jgi:hypothetical protein
MSCGPLADDWLFWDPETIFAYPHSCVPRATTAGVEDAAPESLEPLQLDLFHPPPDGP